MIKLYNLSNDPRVLVMSGSKWYKISPHISDYIQSWDCENIINDPRITNLLVSYSKYVLSSAPPQIHIAYLKENFSQLQKALHEIYSYELKEITGPQYYQDDECINKEIEERAANPTFIKTNAELDRAKEIVKKQQKRFKI